MVIENTFTYSAPKDSKTGAYTLGATFLHIQDSPEIVLKGRPYCYGDVGARNFEIMKNVAPEYIGKHIQNGGSNDFGFLNSELNILSNMSSTFMRNQLDKEEMSSFKMKPTSENLSVGKTEPCNLELGDLGTIGVFQNLKGVSSKSTDTKTIYSDPIKDNRLDGVSADIYNLILNAVLHKKSFTETSVLFENKQFPIKLHHEVFCNVINPTETRVDEAMKEFRTYLNYLDSNMFTINSMAALMHYEELKAKNDAFLLKETTTPKELISAMGKLNFFVTQELDAKLEELIIENPTESKILEYVF